MLELEVGKNQYDVPVLPCPVAGCHYQICNPLKNTNNSVKTMVRHFANVAKKELLDREMEGTKEVAHFDLYKKHSRVREIVKKVDREPKDITIKET